MEVKKAEAKFAMIEDHKPSSDWSKSIYVRCGEGEGSEVFISWTGKQKALIKQFSKREVHFAVYALRHWKPLCLWDISEQYTFICSLISIPENLYLYQKPVRD